MAKSNQTPTRNPNTTNETVERQNGSNRGEAIAQATAFIVENETWMLTTCGSDHIIRSRPMLNVNQSFDGDLYLFACSDHKFLASLGENPQVNIVICEPSNRRYASITGKAQTIDNPKKSELLWNERCSEYFGAEKPGSDISLVEIDVDDVEYWDASQTMMSKLGKLFRMTSTGLSEADVDHQKVDWSQDNHPISESLLDHHRASNG